ncbi:hypothetical protein Landi51_05244 [Colletotrichum acutatum]
MWGFWGSPKAPDMAMPFAVPHGRLSSTCRLARKFQPEANSSPPARSCECMEEESKAAKFCQEVDTLASQALWWVVDIIGNNQEAKLQVRAPPVTLDPYKGYIVNLGWKPNMVFDAGSCQKSCLDAYKTIANTCGHTGGEGNVIAEEGQYDAGCGTYSYIITNTAPRKGELRCNSEGDFPKHKDVHEVTVKQGLKAMCNEVLPDVVTPGHEAITRIYYSK